MFPAQSFALNQQYLNQPNTQLLQPVMAQHPVVCSPVYSPAQPVGSYKAHYHQTTTDVGVYTAINCMQEYSETTFLELRAIDYALNNNVRPFQLT